MVHFLLDWPYPYARISQPTAYVNTKEFSSDFKLFHFFSSPKIDYFFSDAALVFHSGKSDFIYYSSIRNPKQDPHGACSVIGLWMLLVEITQDLSSICFDQWRILEGIALAYPHFYYFLSLSNYCAYSRQNNKMYANG